jgi:hypothetical protein
LQLAQKELGKMGGYKAPRDKLVCILNCCRVINNLLLNMAMAAQGNPPGADDFLPVLIYVVIKVGNLLLISCCSGKFFSAISPTLRFKSLRKCHTGLGVLKKSKAAFDPHLKQASIHLVTSY